MTAVLPKSVRHGPSVRRGQTRRILASILDY